MLLTSNKADKIFVHAYVSSGARHPWRRSRTGDSRERKHYRKIFLLFEVRLVLRKEKRQKKPKKESSGPRSHTIHGGRCW